MSVTLVSDPFTTLLYNAYNAGSLLIDSVTLTLSDGSTFNTQGLSYTVGQNYVELSSIINATSQITVIRIYINFTAHGVSGGSIRSVSGNSQINTNFTLNPGFYLLRIRISVSHQSTTVSQLTPV